MVFGSASIRRKPASKAHDFNALYAHREHSTKFSASCRHSEHTGRSQTAHPKKVLGVQRSHTIVSHSWHFLRGSLFNLWHSSHAYSPHSSQQSSSNAFNALATKQRPTPDTGHHGLVAATIATKHVSTTATGRTREHKLAIDHRPQGDGFAAVASVTEHARRASTSLRTEDASDPPRLTHFTHRRAKSYRHTLVARFTLFDPLQLRARARRVRFYARRLREESSHVSLETRRPTHRSHAHHATKLFVRHGPVPVFLLPRRRLLDQRSVGRDGVSQRSRHGAQHQAPHKVGGNGILGRVATSTATGRDDHAREHVFHEHVGVILHERRQLVA